MVDNAAALPASTPNRNPDPGGPKRPRPHRRKRKHPEPHPRGRPVSNPPQIDITEAQASPVEERPADVASNATASFSTGQGGAEMYHYDRQAMTTQEQTANQLGSAEVAQVRGPGQA